MSVDPDCGDRQSPELSEEYSRMERWMDDHPEFVHDYFARKAKKSMVDGWLLAHAFNHSPGLHIQSDNNSSDSNSRNNSGTNTPVRKISAQEFDKGDTLDPIVSTVDGLPTFLGPSSVPSSQSSTNNKCQRRSRSELKALDEKELMYELVIDICNDLDVTSLCHKILQNVCILIDADRCSLFLVHGSGTEEKHLVSKLFDVNAETSLEEVSENRESIRIAWGTGIIGYVAKTGEPQNIPDAYKDPLFSDEVDIRMGYKTRSILSMPIKDCAGKVIGVAQAVNKSSVENEPFNEHDEKVFGYYLAFCGIGLKNAQLYEKSLLENRRNQVLLDLARVIFEEQSNVANLIYKIMMHTQSLLQCQRCQVMLIEDLSKDKNKKLTIKKSMGIFSQVFDLENTDFDNSDTFNRNWPAEPRFPIHIGISGHVATTGETLNIPDASKDKRFYTKADEESSFVTKSILCMPIKNSSNRVIGVAQLTNKLDATAFNKNDENLFEAFAIFCGMGINNTQMYETAIRAMAKRRIALECLSYHATVPADEANKLKTLTIPLANDFNLLDYTFSDFGLDDDDTLRASIRMFLDLNLVERFRINYEVLCRWLMSVKKNYRNVTYHNWRHAFNVAQTMFCMLKKGQMDNVFTDRERLALMVGCLCHDLDHRGTNNQFQKESMSPLADLYSTSTLEHHHFDQCIMILSTKGNDILSNLKQNEYEDVINLLEGAILSTDLALYFKFRGTFFDLVGSGKANWSTREDRDLLRSMMMTASDVSAITKPWEVQLAVADLIANEFFEQGDMEKAQFKIKPMDMMDRDKKDHLPDMQVNFIDVICMPIYKAMSDVSPHMRPLLDGCKKNRSNWESMSTQTNKHSEDEKENEKHDEEEKVSEEKDEMASS
ncbi:dual 3',5'-cyclic-AMP and -GMP phosphodiesterase 11-like isoform X1 [Mizuhopecten yessoensis]|uniref:dual 3',5'-cyclic-AMP and -GMP phosphodiesterase 11-like isoform X1 n=1 Tax=Mizuhopecten yessoensis TaxID=6573 RepID=UPI000B45E619|nr:dual 3',5'-cyclic-AMP and -GMP phosphodiesterase 11-like isoform X1 [Mizuhopecten yessoensis]